MVWRATGDDQREVLLVHRPRYDDWSLPKGKLARGEHVLVGAAREVYEETGLVVRLGPPLGVQRYSVRKNGATVPKLVHYWSAEPITDGIEFSRTTRWTRSAGCPCGRPGATVSYPRDVELLENLESVVPAVTTVVLLRHTPAVKRRDWDGKDTARPLTPEGAAMAERLIDVLAALGVDRILSSDAERCFATIAPYAAATGLTIEEHPEICERGYEADPDALRGLHQVWSPGHVTVVCSHRPVLPGLSRALGLKVGKFSPGAFLVAHRLTTGRVLAERFGTP